AARDLAGSDIEASTRRVLVREAGDRQWTLVALTAQQVAEHELPTVEKIDRRFRPPRVHTAVEVEALGQGVVTGIIRKALDALLPEPLKDVLVREAAEREHAEALLRGWGD